MKNVMKTRGLAAVAIAATFVGGIAGPAAAQSARQKDKNLMRNLGIGLGAAAVHQAVKGKTTNAIVLGAGAAYAGKKYEDARKAQNKENAYRRVYRWQNGKRVGYYKVRNGKRLGYVRFSKPY